MERAVAIISKVPRLGRSKTRLARTLGAPAALALHRAFLEDELAELDDPGWTLHLVHDAPEGEADLATLDGLLGTRAAGLVPGRRGLAEDLHRAFVELLRGHERAVIVSGDVPQLEARVVRRALDALDEVDLVLGAGPDGGYYLVGLKAPHDVFTSIAMSTGNVVNATIALAKSLGLSVAQVERLTDVDEAQDLLALQHAPEGVGRRSRAVIERLERGEHAALLPTELQVEVTSRCNLPCSACIRTHEDVAPDADLSLEDFVALTDPLPKLERVTFQLNGESLLNPELFAMIDHAKSRGAHTVLNSNGTRLDGVRREKLLATGLDELRVSLDGYRKETVLAMAGADIFEKVTEGVAAFVRERGARPSPRVSLWMVLSRWTAGDLPGLVRLAAELGVEEVYTQRLVLTGYGVAVKENSLFGRIDEELIALVEGAERLAESLGVTLRASGRRPVLESLTPPSGDNPWQACWRPWRSAVVTASKWVIPCCISSFRAPYEVLKMGDLRAQSWSELWNEAPYRAVRRGLLDAAPQPFCAGCTKEWSL